MIWQTELYLEKYGKGYHLITNLIENAIENFPEKGILNIHVRHTSAGITLNENADPSVRFDFNTFMDDLIPFDYKKFTHTLEGRDDMPAHIKASIIGQSVSVPISGYRLNLGTWQGIYFCEFRERGSARCIVLTVYS